MKDKLILTGSLYAILPCAIVVIMGGGCSNTPHREGKEPLSRSGIIATHNERNTNKENRANVPAGTNTESKIIDPAGSDKKSSSAKHVALRLQQVLSPAVIRADFQPSIAYDEKHDLIRVSYSVPEGEAEDRVNKTVNNSLMSHGQVRVVQWVTWKGVSPNPGSGGGEPNPGSGGDGPNPGSGGDGPGFMARTLELEKRLMAKHVENPGSGGDGPPQLQPTILSRLEEVVEAMPLRAECKTECVPLAQRKAAVVAYQLPDQARRDRIAAVLERETRLLPNAELSNLLLVQPRNLRSTSPWENPGTGGDGPPITILPVVPPRGGNR